MHMKNLLMQMIGQEDLLLPVRKILFFQTSCPSHLLVVWLWFLCCPCHIKSQDFLCRGKKRCSKVGILVYINISLTHLIIIQHIFIPILNRMYGNYSILRTLLRSRIFCSYVQGERGKYSMLKVLQEMPVFHIQPLSDGFHFLRLVTLFFYCHHIMKILIVEFCSTHEAIYFSCNFIDSSLITESYIIFS